MLTAREGLIALMLFLTGPALAADLESLKTACDGCHGPNGVSANPAVPIIAGQKPEFIAKMLRGFQMWDRPCVKAVPGSGPQAGTKTDMCKIAGALTDEDITAVGAWYAQQSFVPANQAFDAALAQAGEAVHAENCERCHAQGGTLTERAPRLAGQWTEYLAATLSYVPTGERMCPPLMERKVSELGQEKVTQLLNYWASQQE